MIKIENVQVFGFEPAIRGMRNPMNSWDKSDSKTLANNTVMIGENDLELATRLAKQGPTHAKYRRMIVVYLDITAPLYWWKEFDTYKVGTVANSCSTMHKIHEKKFTLDDFSHEHLFDERKSKLGYMIPEGVLETVIYTLNEYRETYIKSRNKDYWWQLIQLLPSSYNQKRTVMLNYEVLSHIYHDRKDHKLDEWRDFCEFIKNEIPYSVQLIIQEGG